MAVSKKNSFQVFFGTAAEKAAYTSVLLGDKYFETDTGLMFVWTGTAWVADAEDVLTLAAGTALIGKVGIDQVTANANQVVTKTGSVTSATLTAETTKVIGTVNNKVADGDDVALGAKADEAATVGDVTPFSVIAMLKGVYNKLGAVVLAAGTALIGKVGIDQTTPETTNKVTTEGITSSVYSSADVVASGVIKATAGKLLGISGINMGSTQYIQIFDAASVPADTEVPLAVYTVPNGSNFSLDFGMFGLTCAAGICWSNSSTLAIKTIGAADCWVTATYI